MEYEYRFKNTSLDFWKVHPSYRYDPNFPRMEFLGDKIIALEVSLVLMKRELTAGELSTYIAELVRKETLAIVGEFLVPKIKYTGQLTDTVVAACFEAWIGCIYLDGGVIAELVPGVWGSLLDEKFEKSPKNSLQEYAQRNRKLLVYSFFEERDRFVAQVKVGERTFVGKGTSKKHAGENAAQMALDSMNMSKKVCDF